ncbi:MAG: VWA domain-containing protein [Acidobacteriota bacterium]
MSILISHAGRLLSAAVLSAAAIAIVAQQPQQPADQAEVIRISTELVQTGVVVLDKQGRFVEGLKPEQFLLKVDGKVVTPTFFEHVVAGTANEERVEAAVARGNPSNSAPTPAAGSSYHGRTIIFFIDDLHLSAESVQRTRKAILEFVDNQMAPEDLVAVASPSGQIGFLQRFTDLKPVVRAAVGRVSHRPYTIRDSENITMTEYSALRIDAGDKDAISYYAEELLKATNFKVRGAGNLGPPGSGPFGAKNSPQPNSGGMTREMAERNVKERALVLLKQSAAVTVSTLTTLESLMRSSGQMSGRKLAFFISDGFYLNDRNTAFGDKLKQITDAAIRAGVVIYTMDARGLVSMTDATSNRADPEGRLGRSNIGELAASQDPLTALAADTGGRALLNSGALTTAVNNALKETSNYYLLAWRPPAEDQKGGNFKRIEVSINGRPDVTVRLPRGFLMTEPKAAAKDKEPASSDPAIGATSPAKGPEAALISALGAPSARKGLPTTLAVSFVDVPNAGPVLTASTQMATDVLGYGPDGKQTAAIDIAAVVLNDQGKQAGSFKTRLKVNPSAQASASDHPGVIYSHKLPLKPGIYQVRVAARDDQSGRVGSAAQWIEIPDLASKQLTLSSLLVGGQFIGSRQKQAGTATEQVQFSVDRRFARGAHLNFLSIIYNAARGSSGAPELDAQIKISRGGQAIVTSPLRKVVVEAGGDATRIPYGADIALQTLPAGRYLLQVTITDKVAKTTATQQVSFEIE